MSDDILHLSVSEAGRRLGVSRTTAFALAWSGELESVRVHGRRFVPVPAVAAYAARLRSERQREREAWRELLNRPRKRA